LQFGFLTEYYIGFLSVWYLSSTRIETRLLSEERQPKQEIVQKPEM
jgi:hypothetical protein